jgi:hypothetical protein
VRRNLESLILVVVGLAIVAGLAWLTARALAPIFGGAPEPTPTVTAAALRPRRTLVATVAPAPTATAVRAKLTAIPRPTQTPLVLPSPEPEPTVRRRDPTPRASRPTPAPRRTSAPTERWSSARQHSVEAPAKLHEEPDAESHVIARLRPGTIVNVVAERGGWLRVESSVGRRGGWIEARHLRPVR